jgi:hypothetical protein
MAQFRRKLAALPRLSSPGQMCPFRANQENPMLRRLSALSLLVFAALALSGCFVVATNVPAGSGPINDERLEGTWRGLNAQDGKDSDAFLTFQRVDEKRPLRLVWVEGKDLQIYDVITRRVGTRDVFAATLTGPAEQLAKMKPDEPRGYFIGFYEVNGDKATFHLLEAKKIGDLITKGKLKGVGPKGQYDSATLTGSPAELSAFLASPDGQAAQAAEPATLRRISSK